MALSGYATEAGTKRYRTQHAACHPTHFRRLPACPSLLMAGRQGLWASSIGCGTYLGDPNAQTDQRYTDALETALGRGCNLLDTAINYRCQRSERVIGQTLARLVEQGVCARDELILCTKGGYIPFDGDVPQDPSRYLVGTFLNPGIIRYEELVAGCHVLSPRYLEHQLASSLQNLRVSTIDVYYLHNPEQQLDAIPKTDFLKRLEEVFGLLEQKVRDGAIRLFGTATWNGYRANPRDANYLSLAELVELATHVGGSSHHFRVIQVPYNLAMPEAFAFQNQVVKGKTMSVLEAAQTLGLSVVSSASLLQSRLVHLPAAMSRLIPDLQSDAQRAIQFVRSTPGVTTALVGMKDRKHVEENLELATQPPMTPEQVAQLFAKERRSHEATT